MSRRAAGLLVFVAAFVLYLPSLRNAFAYDDVPIIQLDERVHDLSRAHRFFIEPYWAESELGLYRPLTSISFAIDWAAGGGSPTWFHATNAAWNALACLLVFLLLAAIAGTGPALAGALVFAVHPVHVEAVANVVGRSELMAAVFGLAAVLVWIRAPADAAPTLRRAGLAALLLGLALCSKEGAIAVPALVVLADAARGVLTPATARAWLRTRSAPFSLLLVTVAAFVAVRTAVLGELGPDRVDPLLDVAHTPGARILTALQVWPVIVRLLLFPRELLADYGPHVLDPVVGLQADALLGALILLLLVAGGVAAWWRGAGLAALALLVLPLLMLPVSNLIIPIGVLLAERTLYLPSLAVPAAVALAVRWVLAQRAALPRAGVAATAALALVLALFTARTLVRIPEWRDTEAIMRAQGRDRPETFRVAWYDARAAAAAGHDAEALQRYGAALRMWPHRRRVVVEAAAFAAHAGDLPFAFRLAGYAAERWPSDVASLRLLAATALDMADTTTARSAIFRGLAVQPNDPVLLQMRSAITDGSPQ